MYAARAPSTPASGELRAARAEFDYGAAACHFHPSARSFGGNERLEGHRREHVGFRDLRLDDGRADGENRLAGKHRHAFGDGEEIAGETEVAEAIRRRPAIRGGNGRAAEIIDLFAVKLQVSR